MPPEPASGEAAHHRLGGAQQPGEVHRPGEPLEDQQVLAREVAVQGRGADLGALGDLLHRRLVVALLEEQLERGLDEEIPSACDLQLAQAHGRDSTRNGIDTELG